MAIKASTPFVVAAKSEVVYDEWHITKIIGNILPPPGVSPVFITLTRSRKDENGNIHLIPASDEDKKLEVKIPNLWAEAGDTQEVASLVEAMINAVNAYVVKKNLN